MQSKGCDSNSRSAPTAKRAEAGKCGQKRTATHNQVHEQAVVAAMSRQTKWDGAIIGTVTTPCIAPQSLHNTLVLSSDAADYQLLCRNLLGHSDFN
jgi:hypothetical protein